MQLESDNYNLSADLQIKNSISSTINNEVIGKIETANFTKNKETTLTPGEGQKEDLRIESKGQTSTFGENMFVPKDYPKIL